MGNEVPPPEQSVCEPLSEGEDPFCGVVIDCYDFCCIGHWSSPNEWTIDTDICKALYDGEFASGWIDQGFDDTVHVGDNVSVDILVLACGKLLVAVGSEFKDWITEPGLYHYDFENIDDTYVMVYAQHPFGDCVVDYVCVYKYPCILPSVMKVAHDQAFFTVGDRFFEPFTNESEKQCFRICSTFDQSNCLFLFNPMPQ